MKNNYINNNKSKFLVTILSSSNEKLLKLVYSTVINQKNHNLDFTIVIVVNSLDQSYYGSVCKEFESINVEIIQTESNGKPGKGHNSLFYIFNIKKEFDYMISLDGDDFLYPYAFYQLTKCFDNNNNVDCICIYGNDTIRDYDSPYDASDIYLTNHFYLRLGYNIPKKFSNSNLIKDPFTYDINQGVQTIIRFIMCSREFINKNITNELYCEKCYILDDYRFYLNFVDNIVSKKINGLIINSDHIYLYNNLNNNCVSKQYNDRFTLDYKIITDYLNDFIHLKYYIENWNLDFIPYKQLSPVFEEEFNLIDNNNGVFSFDKTQLETKQDFIYLIDFGKKIAIEYYKLCINNIEDYLFNNINDNNKTNAFNLCLYLVNNKIIDNKLFIYMAICYYYTNDTKNCIKYIEKSKYMKYKYPLLNDFYNLHKTK